VVRTLLVAHGVAEDDSQRVLAAVLAGQEEADLVVDYLDIGVVLFDEKSRVLRSNHAASHALVAFGSDPTAISSSLRVLLRPLIETAGQVSSRFTPAAPIVSGDGRRFFARCRCVPGDRILLTIAAATLRELDVQRVLAKNFGLSAQETRIAFYAAQGYRNREIAARLQVVEGTVKNYLTTIFAALSVRSRTELAGELAQLVEEQSDVHRGRS
jgi:DNA-binding NarL/FixJ family response regulator